MLTKLTAYDQANRFAPLELPLTPEGRLLTDVLQVTNISGLEPVEASVNTSPYGSIDGTFFTGSNVNDRNIVIDLLPKPDWNTWDIATIRNHVYKYFMPKSFVRLVFESTERPPVEIFGYVQTCTPNIFSKDNEIQVSLICPDPHFKAVDSITVEGVSDPEGGPHGTQPEIVYTGTVETGFYLRVDAVSDPSAELVLDVHFEEPYDTNFIVLTEVDLTKYLEINSLSGNKYVREVVIATLVPKNLMGKIQEGSIWPKIYPGSNLFRVITDGASQEWTLTYFNRYGGL